MAVFDRALLTERMRRAWRHGDRLALAWTAVHGALRVLMVEQAAFLALCRARPDLWAERRYRPPTTLRELQAELDDRARLIEVVMIGRLDASAHGQIEAVVERFSIRLSPHLPVALVDLVGFSKLGPIQQLARLSGLEKSLCRAEVTLARAGLGIAPMRTTTGDGFYVWTPTATDDRTVRLLALVLVTFVHFAAAGRDAGFDAGELKATLGIGACFSLHRLAQQTPQDDTYVVGAVTVELARLMSACQPGQILLGTGHQHRYLDSWRQAITALNGVFAAADATLGFRLQARLTGRGDAPDAGERYVVRAKHGCTYTAVNLAGEVVDAGERARVRLGVGAGDARSAA
jgi:hypothetical protein